MKIFEVIFLSKEQKVFLNAFRPKNRMLTTFKEIKQISKALGLYSLSVSELHCLRNSVVDFYNTLMALTDNLNDEMSFMQPLQSVTATIDYVISGKNGEV